MWYLVFLLKFVAGCANLYVHNHYYLTNDLFFYYQQAVEELVKGRENPRAFITTWLFDWEDMIGHINFFKKENMVYWSTLGTLVHTKLMTLFTILTLGREYLNVLFYNFLFFIGQLAFFKTLYHYFPNKKWLLLGAVFLVPSVLFWCSGIHKDGLVFSITGMLVFCTHRVVYLKQHRYWIGLVLSLFLLLVIRYFYFLCILPPLILLFISSKRKDSWLIFILGYCLLAIGFFFAKYVSPLDPMKLVVNRQAEYFLAQGYSDMATPRIENNIQSFGANLPTALNHVFLQPYPAPWNKTKYLIQGLDTWAILLLLFLSLIYLSWRKLNHSLFLFLLFYCFTVLLFMGYTIPNLGALVRYRSVFVGMLLPLMLAVSDIPVPSFLKWGNKK